MTKEEVRFKIQQLESITNTFDSFEQQKNDLKEEVREFFNNNQDLAQAMSIHDIDENFIYLALGAIRRLKKLLAVMN